MIKYVQTRDASGYECQISTQPIRKTFIWLNIIGNDIYDIYRNTYTERPFYGLIL